MELNLKSAKRILILGDAGRGKTTLAHILSEKIKIPAYSTDDFFWQTKFTDKKDIQTSITEIKKIYSTDQWIVEGTTRHLLEPGFIKADIIIYLGFKNVLEQWWGLVKRHQSRKNEKIFDLLKLLRHVLYKKYNLGYKKGQPTILQLLEPYRKKIIFLYSRKEIDEFERDI